MHPSGRSWGVRCQGTGKGRRPLQSSSHSTPTWLSMSMRMEGLWLASVERLGELERLLELEMITEECLRFTHLYPSVLISLAIKRDDEAALSWYREQHVTRNNLLGREEPVAPQ